jgi:type II restriction enzyme
LPPSSDDAEARAVWETDLAKVREESASAQKAHRRNTEEEQSHTEIQGLLRDLG